MNVEFDSPAAYGLGNYVRLVVEHLGLSGESSFVQLDSLANAYIALDDRLPGLPGRDLALTWDEEHGWAMAVETHSAEDLVVLAWMGGDVLPSPRAVAEFARRARGDAPSGERGMPVLRDRGDRDDLEARLAGYLPDLITVTPG